MIGGVRFVISRSRSTVPRFDHERTSNVIFLIWRFQVVLSKGVVLPEGNFYIGYFNVS